MFGARGVDKKDKNRSNFGEYLILALLMGLHPPMVSMYQCNACKIELKFDLLCLSTEL